LLPATVSPDLAALVGLHEWTDDDFPNVAQWGIQSFGPDELRASSQPVLDWLAATGCSRH
jgi:arginase